MPEYEYRLPKVTASIDIHTPDKQIISEQFQILDIPKDIMDELKSLIGDGLARVTVSADMGIKDFGTGAGAMATVSLTCDQSVAGVERAAQIAGSMARDIANEQRQRAENELQNIISERGQSR